MCICDYSLRDPPVIYHVRGFGILVLYPMVVFMSCFDFIVGMGTCILIFVHLANKINVSKE